VGREGTLAEDVIAMQAFVEVKLEGIRALCRAYGVARPELFGSAATDDFDAGRSDVDFLATYPDGYDSGPWLGRLQDFERDLAELLGRVVDVVMISALNNKWFRREAEKTRTVVYEVDANRALA